MQQAAMSEKKAKTFRVSWLRLYATMAFLELLVLLPSLFLMHHRLPSVSDVPAVLAALLAMLGFAFLLAVFFPTRLNADSIKGFNFWGLPCKMSWEEIVSVTQSRALGLPWLIVRSNRIRNAMWMPLFYADSQGFREALAEFAPPSCPLSSYGSSS
jgi:hypothetical protein